MDTSNPVTSLPPGYALEPQAQAPAQAPAQAGSLPEGYTLEQPGVSQPVQPHTSSVWDMVKGMFTGNPAPEATGSQTSHEDYTGNDHTVITPKPGESFADTMARARTMGQSVTPQQMDSSAQNGIGIAKNVGIGAVKSAGQTLKTVATLGGNLGTKSFNDSADAALTPDNQDQQLGAHIETIAEFIAGDEALKSLSLGEKFAQVGKVAKFMESNPRLASILADAIRTGTVGGVVGGIHGGTEGAIQGAEGGALLGGGLSALGKVPGVLSDLKGGVSDLANNISKDGLSGAFKKSAASKAGDVIDSEAAVSNPARLAAQKAVKDAPIKAGDNPNLRGEAPGEYPVDYQPELQSGLQQIAKDTATKAGVPYETPASPRDTFGVASRNVLGSSKADFTALDEASGGRWQRYNDTVRNIEGKMDEVAGIDDEMYSKLEAKRDSIVDAQTKLIEDLKTQGKIDPEMADRAVTNYKHGMALDDVNKAVKMSTERNVVLGDDGKTKLVENINPQKLAVRLAKLNDLPAMGGTSRLEQALGKDGAKALFDHVDDAVLNADAAKMWTPEAKTGQEAMIDLLEKNTSSAPNMFNRGRQFVDYKGALKDFDAMDVTARENMFDKDLASARRWLQTKAYNQAVLEHLKIAGKYAPFGLVGLKVAGHLLGKLTD